MEKGFRLTECPICKIPLKLPIKEEHYGKTLKVRCPKCKKIIGKVTIPIPAEELQKETARSSPQPPDDDFAKLFSAFHVQWQRMR